MPGSSVSSDALPPSLNASLPPSLVLARQRLEQLHGVARWIVDNDLGAAGAGHDVARAEGNPRCTQPRNFRGEIVHLKMDAIPATGYLLAAIRQRALPRTPITAEEEAHAVPYDRRKGRRGVMFRRKAEERGIEAYRTRHVIDYVAHADPGHRQFSCMKGINRLVPPERSEFPATE